MTAINWDYGSHLRNEALRLPLRRGDSNSCHAEVHPEVEEEAQVLEDDEYEDTPSLIPKRRYSRDEHFDDEQNNSMLATIVEPTFFLFAAMLVGMSSALAAVARLRS